jgi:hypothetical protein
MSKQLQRSFGQKGAQNDNLLVCSGFIKRLITLWLHP